MDETGHTFRARLSTTWAPAGQPPVLRRRSRRREVSSILAVTPAGRIAARHVWGTIHGPDVIRALGHFHRVFRRALLIVWDRANTHTDRRVQTFVAAHPAHFATWPLPPYAPELNPEEQANAIIKRRMANALPDSVAELRAWACRGVRYLQRHPTLVQHFFEHAGLPC